MGSKNQAAQQSENSPSRPPGTPTNMPEGFDLVTPRKEDGWFAAKEGLTIVGEILGRFQRTDPNTGQVQYFYQIGLTKEVEASVRLKGAKEYTTGLLKPGALLNVNESKALEDLVDLVEGDSRWEIWIEVGSKEKVKSNSKRSFWKMTVGKKRLS